MLTNITDTLFSPKSRLNCFTTEQAEPHRDFIRERVINPHRWLAGLVHSTKEGNLPSLRGTGGTDT